MSVFKNLRKYIKLALTLFLKTGISIVIFPLALVIALIVRTRSHAGSTWQILMAGIETSANLRQISHALGTVTDYTVDMAEFLEHPFYSQVPFDCKKVITVLTLFASDSFFIRAWKIVLRPFYMFPVLFRYDVIFFNWAESFLPGNADLVVFKLARKKIFVRHCGSDVRYRPLQHGVHSQFGVYQWRDGKRSCFSLIKKAWHQRMAERFATVMSTRDHATFQKGELTIRPYIQTELPKTTGFQRERPLLVHAPSDPRIKGTDIVVEVVNKLKEKGFNFDFQLLSGVEHETVLKYLSEATIIIDQPGAVPARFSVEGMASGCVVVGGNVPEINDCDSCPVVRFKPDADSLEKVLERLLTDQNLCEQIGDEGRRYWKDKCSIENYLAFFKDLLAGEAPTFSRVPEHENYLWIAAETWYEKMALKLLYR